MSVSDLYKNTHVPLPSKSLEVNKTDTVEDICKKIDAFFDDITAGYPLSTKEMVHSMYYNDEGVFGVPKLIEENNALAQWQVYPDEGGTHCIFMDRRVQLCPVIMRICKIHEIAGHAGQAHQRIGSIGFNNFLEEIRNATFDPFTDQSGALIEKMLIDAIPISVIKEDLALMNDPVAAAESLRMFQQAKTMSYEDYSLLLHRVHDCPVAANLSIEDFDRLHSRPDVKAFDKKMGMDVDEGQAGKTPPAPDLSR